MKDRTERAREWLVAAHPITTEDRNMQLLGLHWAGADRKVLRKMANTILAGQRPDGGWSQQPELASDAYATGQIPRCPRAKRRCGTWRWSLSEGREVPALDPACRRVLVRSRPFTEVPAIL